MRAARKLNPVSKSKGIHTHNPGASCFFRCVTTDGTHRNSNTAVCGIFSSFDAGSLRKWVPHHCSCSCIVAADAHKVAQRECWHAVHICVHI